MNVDFRAYYGIDYCGWENRENSNMHQGEAKKSLMRATSIIGMAPDIDPNSWDHTEEQKYGLGTGNEFCYLSPTKLSLLV